VKVGSLPVTVHDGAATTPGRINGHAVTFAIASGSTDPWLSERFADEIGLHGVASRLHLVTSDGLYTVRSAQVEELVVGPYTFRGERIGIVKGLDSPHGDAMIGAPFLFGQHEAELSLATGEIGLFRSTGCEKAWLAYWSHDAVEVPMRSNTMGRSTVVLPVRIDGHVLNAILSTGSPRSQIDLRVARDIGLVPVEGHPGVAHVGRFELGTEAIEDARIGVADLNTGGHREVRRSRDFMARTEDIGWTEMVLGQDFLTSHRVLVSSMQKKAYVSYVGGKPFRPEGDLPDVMPPASPTAVPTPPAAAAVAASAPASSSASPKDTLR
jgi:hypothetical protein